MNFTIKNHFVILFILLLNVNLFSQEQKLTSSYIDSLILEFEASVTMSSGDFKEIDKFCSLIESLSKKIGYDEGVFSAYMMYCETYRDFSVKKTNGIIAKSDNLIRLGKIDNPSLLIRYYLIKGYTEGSKGFFLNEIKFYLKADSIADKYNVYEAKRYINQSICSYYIASEQYDKALELAVANMKDNQKDSLSYFVDIENVAIIHSYLNNNDSAILYLNKVINEGYGEYSDLHYQYFSLGRAYLDIDKLDSAEKYLRKSYVISIQNYQNTVDIVNLYNNLANLYDKREYSDSSQFYYDLAYKVSDSINYLHGKLMASRGELINELKKNNLLNAFNRYISIKDSIVNRESKDLEKKLLIENETLKKEAKIKELELKKEADKNHKLLLYGILLLALIVFSFVIYRYILSQKILKKNLEIEEYKKQQAVNELKKKEQELSSKINVIQSNIKVIEELKNKELKSINLTDITSVFEQNYISDVEWQNIALQFNEIHPNYINSIKEDDISLTQNDIRLLILLKLEYSNQAIAEILNISVDGVKKAKYRLKKKVTAL